MELKYPKPIRRKSHPELSDEEIAEIRRKNKLQRKAYVIVGIWTYVFKILAILIGFIIFIFLVFIK